MEHQYAMADLRLQYINGRPLFPPISPPPPPPPQEILSGHHRSLTAAAAQQHYEMVLMGGHHGVHQEFQSDSATVTTSIVSGGTPNSGFSGLDMEGSGGIGGGDGGTARWPRQETLTLLEIRSRLDSKFKEANQKGPLWDEVSRVMSEEHGYHRSGKKCREKFENLYKYYKKTKEGKAGRQDGKHYRFFRQLEAIYGESNMPPAIEPQLAGGSFQYNVAANMNTSAPNQEPFSLSNSSDFDTTSSDDSDVNITMENDSMGKRKKRSKRSWKAKVKDFIDGQMKKLMDKQEAWLEKMMKTIENREQERLIREEAWRKREEARIEKEHQFWAKERAWIEARDAALMEALQKVTGKEYRSSHVNQKEFDSDAGQDSFAEARRSFNRNPNQNGTDGWLDCEVTRLIQLRTIMESRFNQVGCTEILWEEISAKMASLGYERSPLMCKEKWNSINDYLMKCNRNSKDNPLNCYNVQSHDVNSDGGVSYWNLSDQQGHDSIRLALNDHSSSQGNCSTSNTTMHEGCFRYFMSDAENLWENYFFKHCKGDNN